MNICVLDFNPTIGGVSTWGVQLVKGLNGLSNTAASYCSISISGKRLKEWPLSTQPIKKAEALDQLSEYDLVIFAQPNNIRADREARRYNRSPYIMELASGLRTRWTIALHDRAKGVFNLEPMVKYDNFCGRMISDAEGLAESHNFECSEYIMERPFSNDGHPILERTNSFASFGRIARYKGQRDIAAALIHISKNNPDIDKIDFNFYGQCVSTPGVCESRVIYDMFVDANFNIVDAYEATDNRHSGFAVNKGPVNVTFHSRYVHWSRITSSVFVHSTNPVNYVGPEYTMLEAMTNGMMIVADSSMCHPSMYAFHHSSTPESIAEAIVECNDYMRSAEYITKEVAMNRNYLYAHHDPAKVARGMITSIL